MITNTATAAILPMMQPDNYLVIDIETGYASDDVVSEMIKQWEPPANIKDPEKLQARLDAYAEEARAKSALTDAAPIVSIAINGQVGLSKAAYALHSMGAALPMPALDAMGVQVVGFDTEATMLSALTAILDTIANPETVLVGHNLVGFDLAKLRNRMVRSKAALPAALRPAEENQPVYDTMRHAKWFSIEAGNSPFFSFKKLEAALGLTNAGHKDIMSGAEVPAKHAEAMAAKTAGNVQQYHDLATLIVAYNWQDVIQEEKAFRMMTGRY